MSDQLVYDDAEAERRIRSFGLVRDAFAAIQIDINPAIAEIDGQSYDATFCDHNCSTEIDGVPTGGQYTCPAALSDNKGLKKNTMAPVELLLDGLRTTVAGIRQSRGDFFDQIFPQYCCDWQIPSQPARLIRQIIDTDIVEVNLFGGSPEIHPGILTLIEELRGLGVRVHVTTTGRRLMVDLAFAAEFLRQPPDLLALGADDFENADHVYRLASMSMEDLRREWRGIPWYYGQKRKTYEAMYLVQMANRRTLGEFPPLLFNIVIHPGNIRVIGQILDALAVTAPDAVLNPYPVQTAFIYGSGEFDEEELVLLHEFIDEAIAQHQTMASGGSARWPLAKRLHYWLMLKAALAESVDAAQQSGRISGNGIWKCYERSGAGRCVQVGSSKTPYGDKTAPGGHLGCYWNAETVTDRRQFWDMDADDVQSWVLLERVQLGSQSPKPCPGCAFPRMSFDSVSLELGMVESLRPHYLQLRASALGY
jgi:hypothetical protein